MPYSDVKGTVAGALNGTVAHIAARSDTASQTVGNAQPVEQTVYQNAKSIDLPATVPVKSRTDTTTTARSRGRMPTSRPST